MQYFFGNRSFLRGYYGVVFRPLGNVGKNKWSINFILSCDIFMGLIRFLEKTYINIKSNRYLIFDAKRHNFSDTSNKLKY